MSRPDTPDGPGGTPFARPLGGSPGDLAEAAGLTFAFFHEVQVVAQVSAALLATRLPDGVSTQQ